MVRDADTYRNLTAGEGGEAPVQDTTARGHQTVRLEGRKLHGGYALTRMRQRGRPEGWLLVKMRDQAADTGRGPRRTEPASARPGRTLEQVASRQRR